MLKKLCSLLSVIVMIVLLVTAVIMVVPNFIGWKTMAVLSGSMEPEIPVGAVVWVKPSDPQTLTEGDIISFKMSGDTVVTHRIAEIDSENQQFITKGDANEHADGNPVDFENVIGREVFHLPLLGYISIYIKTPLGIAVTCGVLIIIILLNVIPELLEGKGDEKDEE